LSSNVIMVSFIVQLRLYV